MACFLWLGENIVKGIFKKDNGLNTAILRLFKALSRDLKKGVVRKRIIRNKFDFCKVERTKYVIL
ncbi:MAG: hypothetical protein DYG83_15030 [Candidatus Brocadia sp. AMX2]|nr:MAG: hypothetical protein EDM70_14350 [Candidatus Brocadia sp. AMX2]MBC6933801.1 hypothetical protein [Candidatus Brocadia sp.]MBL1170553.1 hypothetical protein [Candidatus Brocadia sp. AMX1]GIK14496.1 MAG: hypothetical protein BroJett002_32030 [Candidatus Brocadia sinica]MCE7868105.1 hypothetical protein [Candidatus Brocadia sp. AMX2]